MSEQDGLFWTPYHRQNLATLHRVSCNRASKNPTRRIPLHVLDSAVNITLSPCNFCKPELPEQYRRKGQTW